MKEQLTNNELVKVKEMLEHYLNIQEFTNMEYLEGKDLEDLREEFRFFAELSPKLDRMIGTDIKGVSKEESIGHHIINGKIVTAEEWWNDRLQMVVDAGTTKDSLYDLMVDLDMNIGESLYVDDDDEYKQVLGTLNRKDIDVLYMSSDTYLNEHKTDPDAVVNIEQLDGILCRLSAYMNGAE